MTGDRPVVDARRTISDRDPVDNLPLWLAFRARVECPPHAPPRSELSQQFFLEHVAGLNEQAALGRFVRHHASCPDREIPV
ncbi:MAG: hypothetical protein NBKEAIPA_03134 [Nitrospirae bacterium]|nr:hypothetical protein [Nitrospirota bacterium]